MTANEIVLFVIKALESSGIPYMLVGSYSSNAFGISRSTGDADFVVEIDQQRLVKLFGDLSSVITFEPQMLLESVTGTSRFVGRAKNETFKVELFMLSHDTYDRARFERRGSRPFLNTTAFLPTPEDVLVQKLKWYGRARRAKDLDDARNVVAVQLKHLDLSYIRLWCDQHGTREIFEQLLTECQNIEQELS